MKFDPRWLKKWMDPSVPQGKGISFRVFDKCVFAVRDGRRGVRGLTVFDSRDLGPELIGRIQARRERGALPEGKYEFYLPPFLAHRWGVLSSELSFEAESVFTPFVQVQEVSGSFQIRSSLRVINVDDSPVLLKLLKHHLSASGFVDVVAQVSDPRQAVETIRKYRPDVITMDIQMPGKNGVQVVRELLEREAWPILMISSLALEEGSLVFEALNAGAFDYLQKPRMEESEDFRRQIVEKILLAVASENAGRTRSFSAERLSVVKGPSQEVAYDPRLIWCLGASTGGTQALTRVFTSMPTHIPPTVIVQHIPPVFSKSFADSLDNLVPFKVCEATDGQELLPDHVYIAPGGRQMAVVEKGASLRIRITDDPPVNRFKPSVDYLFESVAKLKDRQFVAAILTGMGKDGAEGLLKLKKIGARTIAQDEASCAVFGMPRAALEIGAADEPTPLDRISSRFLEFSRKKDRAA